MEGTCSSRSFFWGATPRADEGHPPLQYDVGNVCHRHLFHLPYNLFPQYDAGNACHRHLFHLPYNLFPQFDAGNACRHNYSIFPITYSLNLMQAMPATGTYSIFPITYSLNLMQATPATAILHYSRFILHYLPLFLSRNPVSPCNPHTPLETNCVAKDSCQDLPPR